MHGPYNIHVKGIIYFASILQQWLHKHASMLRYMYIVLLALVVYVV
jgi:hypothetical protein